MAASTSSNEKLTASRDFLGMNSGQELIEGVCGFLDEPSLLVPSSSRGTYPQLMIN